MYKKKPLPLGLVVNKLTILDEVLSTEKGRRYVYCRCECGSQKVIRYDQLKSGKVKSCGCLLSSKSKSQIEKMIVTRRRRKEAVVASEYIGRKFGELVICSVFHHPKYKGTWFVVKCNCGKVLNVSLARLKCSHTKSCGCIRRKRFTEFFSNIDGEKILLDGSKGSYVRIGGTKELLHVHEAKKIAFLAGIKWNENMVVHHVDGNKKNNELDNLSIIQNNAIHRRHHAKVERAMYSFLTHKNLLKEFYASNPDLKLVVLSGLV